MMTSTFGPAYVEERDGERIALQMDAIYQYLSQQRWLTLSEIEDALGYPQASISAQLRNLRKPRFGGHRVIKRYVSNGLWAYQLHRHHAFADGECECGDKQGQQQLL